MSDTAGERDPRVYLASERTALAWVRTGLALMGFGFIVARFGFFLTEMRGAQAETPPAFGVSQGVGIALVLLGVAVNVAGAARHARLVDRYNRGVPLRWSTVSTTVVLAAVLAALGLALAMYLGGLR